MKKVIKIVCMLMSTILISVAVIGCEKEAPKDDAQNQEEYVEGNLQIPDMYAWVDYPQSDIDAILLDTGKKPENITFSDYDETMIEIDAKNMKVKALKSGSTLVTAVAGKDKTVFLVTCQVIYRETSVYYTDRHTTGSDRWYQTRGETNKKIWEEQGIDGVTTLFLGDSFFDEDIFWTNFYEDYYANNDALCMGVSSTTTEDWETYINTFLKDTKPRNIVMHIGTNNICADRKTAKEVISDLQRMFYALHEALPDTQFYWFTISYRTNESGNAASKDANNTMKQWCANRDWITCVDTAETLTTDMLLDDGIHPKLESYRHFTNALMETDIKIESR